MGNLTKRILSAAVLAPSLLALTFFGTPWLFFSVVVFFAAVCGFELGTFSLIPEYRRYRYVLAGLSATCAAGVGLYSTYPIAPVVCFFLLPVLCFFSFLFSAKDPKNATSAFGSCLSGAVYTGALTGFVALTFSSTDDGYLWVFTLLLATSLGDTFAYGFGRAFGRHKLSRTISPNKTWEGSFGGFVGAFASVFASSYFFLHLPLIEVFLLSLVLNVACQLGDLSESFLKRGFGVKDSGKIIPGHGGLLDRIDALIFGAPVVFFFSILR